jgi:hypothetical protein
MTVTSKRYGLPVMMAAGAGTESKESTIFQQRPLLFIFTHSFGRRALFVLTEN